MKHLIRFSNTNSFTIKTVFIITISLLNFTKVQIKSTAHLKVIFSEIFSKNKIKNNSIFIIIFHCVDYGLEAIITF